MKYNTNSYFHLYDCTFHFLIATLNPYLSKNMQIFTMYTNDCNHVSTSSNRDCWEEKKTTHSRSVNCLVSKQNDIQFERMLTKKNKQRNTNDLQTNVLVKIKLKFGLTLCAKLWRKFQRLSILYRYYFVLVHPAVV